MFHVLMKLQRYISIYYGNLASRSLSLQPEFYREHLCTLFGSSLHPSKWPIRRRLLQCTVQLLLLQQLLAKRTSDLDPKHRQTAKFLRCTLARANESFHMLWGSVVMFKPIERAQTNWNKKCITSQNPRKCCCWKLCTSSKAAMSAWACSSSSGSSSS